jgi:epoxide hydrolase-like predicted phosphatase
MTLKGIIFDFGGVLVRMEDDSIRYKMAERLGITKQELIEVLFESDTCDRAMTGTITQEEYWQEIKTHFKMTEEELVQFREDIFRGERLNTELLDLIGSLPADFKKAILSNAWNDSRQIFTDIFHLDQYFDLMVISAEEKITKPADEIYLLTARRMNLNPWELLFIDDLLHNAQAAAKVGMAAIHYKDTASTINQIKTLLKSQGVEISSDH